MIRVTWTPKGKGKRSVEVCKTTARASSAAAALAKLHKVSTFGGEFFWDAECMDRLPVGGSLEAQSPRGIIIVEIVS